VPPAQSGNQRALFLLSSFHQPKGANIAASLRGLMANVESNCKESNESFPLCLSSFFLFLVH